MENIGMREPGRGEKFTVYLGGVVPFSFVKKRVAQLQTSDVHLCGPGGTEVAQIYVDKQARSMGSLTEVPREALVKYKEGIIGADGKPVTVTAAELKQASAKDEAEVRVCKTTPAQAIPTEWVKSVFYLAAQKGMETTFLLVTGCLWDKQISFNMVEGGQLRRAIIQMEGNQPILKVLYLPSEVSVPVPAGELPAAMEKLKPQINLLLKKMETAELEPVTEATKVQKIEELFMAKAQGRNPTVEVVQVPTGDKKLEELLKVALG